MPAWTGRKRVAVATADQLVSLTARHAVVICTGSTAAVPDIPGVAEAKPWTNRRATDSSTVPPRLAVVGAGGVGVEMATAWHGLGSKVTCWPAARGCYRGWNRSSASSSRGSHRSRSRRPHRRFGDGAAPPRRYRTVTVILDNGDQLEVDEILFATGRTPNTGDIGLETVGLSPGSWLDVDDTCVVRGVDGDWLYAMGDANHRALLTHQGKYQARMAGNAIGARANGQVLDTTPWGAHVATADATRCRRCFSPTPRPLCRVDHDAGRGVGAPDQDRRRQHRRTVPGANFYADGYTVALVWSSTWTTTTCWGSRSSDRESPNSCIRPPSQSPVGCPSIGCGTPCRASRPSVKCGCA